MPKHLKKKIIVNPQCCSRGCLKEDTNTQDQRMATLFNFENSGGYVPVLCCVDNKTYVIRAILDEPVNSIRIKTEENGVKAWTETAIKNRDNFKKLSVEKCSR